MRRFILIIAMSLVLVSGPAWGKDKSGNCIVLNKVNCGAHLDAGSLNIQWLIQVTPSYFDNAV